MPSSRLKPLEAQAAGGREKRQSRSLVSLPHHTQSTSRSHWYPTKALSSPHISSLLCATLKARPSAISCQGVAPSSPASSDYGFSPTQWTVRTPNTQIPPLPSPPPVFSQASSKALSPRLPLSTGSAQPPGLGSGVPPSRISYQYPHQSLDNKDAHSHTWKRGQTHR